MNKRYFNDDNSKRGIEGWYYFHKETLIIYINPTNSTEDWISNFIAFPVYSTRADCFVHAGYWKYALWACLYINDMITENPWIEDIVIFGYSMGGGVVQIMERYRNIIRPHRIVSIDGPRTTSEISNRMKLVFNRGSLVNRLPFWFKRIKNAVCLSDKWRPFWVSHGDYDIDGIIKDGEL